MTPGPVTNTFLICVSLFTTQGGPWPLKYPFIGRQKRQKTGALDGAGMNKKGVKMTPGPVNNTFLLCFSLFTTHGSPWPLKYPFIGR